MGIRIRVRPKRPGDTSESSSNTGSAKVLAGRIFVLCVFVGRHANPWRTADIDRQKQKVYEAERWLRMQALRYGKNVEFVNVAYGADGSFLDDCIPENSKSNRAYFYPSEVVKKIGFPSKQAFMQWARTHEGCPQCMVVVFANTSGRSYASPVTKELQAHNPERFGLEGCLLYRRYDDYAEETNTAAIAHEMLHLFGAWDLYELDSNDRKRAEKTSLMFPNSVMLNSHRDIWQLQIDEINAWLVGLRDCGKDWYRWFEPNQECYECE